MEELFVNARGVKQFYYNFLYNYSKFLVGIPGELLKFDSCKWASIMLIDLIGKHIFCNGIMQCKYALGELCY